MRKILSLILLCGTVLFFSCLSYSQIAVGLSEEDRAEFARHRAALLACLGDEVAVIFGEAVREDSLRFRQNNTFYYFTGVEIPCAALVLDGRDDSAALYLMGGNDNIWTGKRIGPGPEAVAEFGIAVTKYVHELPADLQNLVHAGGRIGLVFTLEPPIAGSPGEAWRDSSTQYYPPWYYHQTPTQRYRAWLESTLPGVTVFDITTYIMEMRSVKSDWEIARITEACRIAGEGFAAALQATEPGVYEYEIEAATTGVYVREGALYPSFSAIVGAGKNTAILHYPEAAAVVKKKDLVLMDYGPDYRYYSADITRTWPAKGKFSKKHRKVYEDCLEIQEQLISFIKPGVTLRQIADKNKALMQDMGYGGVGINYFHGPSHYLGMSVHDVGLYDAPLVPGCVITVEPGIYYKGKWGVRIEDNVLVTSKGCRVLSDMVPKDPDEIEALMAGTGNTR
jgi:Xaa-Pro aminopeptidase